MLGLRLGAVALLSFACAGTALADQFRIDFTGQVESLTGTSGTANVSTLFSVNDAVSGFAIYDAGEFVLLDRFVAFELTIAGQNYSATGGSVLAQNSGQDALTIDSPETTPGIFVNGPDAGSAEAVRMQLGLRAPADTFPADDPQVNQLPSLSALTTFLAANTGDGNTNFLTFESVNGVEVVRFGFSSLSASLVDDTDGAAVPLPASALLLLGGLGALVIRCREGAAGQTR
ncbi:MAG: hypothetical protein AAF968_24845 [Pseudomonadota bacterium]